MTGYIDEKVNKLIINQLTREEYKELKEQGLVKRNEIYLFPDSTEDDIETLKQKVEELIASHNELVEIVVEGNSEHPAIVDVLFGKDGKDGLVDKVRDLENVKIEVEDLKLRTEIIEKWIESWGSEGTVGERVTALENTITNNITPQITNITNELKEMEDLILYCGTSTEVMDESSEV